MIVYNKGGKQSNYVTETKGKRNYDIDFNWCVADVTCIYCVSSIPFCLSTLVDSHVKYITPKVTRRLVVLSVGMASTTVRVLELAHSYFSAVRACRHISTTLN